MSASHKKVIDYYLAMQIDFVKREGMTGLDVQLGELGERRTACSV